MKNLLIVLCLFLLPIVYGQEPPIEPLTSNPEIAAMFDFSDAAAIDITPSPEDMIKLDEIRSNPETTSNGVLLPLDIDLKERAQCTELNNGDKLWVLVLTADRAAGLKVYLPDYNIPQGAALFIYPPGKEKVQLADTDYDRHPVTKELFSWDFKGDRLVIEYYEPKKASFQAKLKIGEFLYFFRDTFSKKF